MKKRALVKYALISLGGLVILNGIVACAVSNLNLGLFLVFALGMILVAFGVFMHVLPKWARCGLAFCLCAAVVMSTVIFVGGVFDNATYNEDAVIVLGAGLRGETPSLTLRNRLDRALDYYEKNPDCIIVVTGGQGQGEDITEALAMERYLVAHGVPEEKIIKEELSTSTYENFENARLLLSERFLGDYSTVIITNDFHILRAVSTAKKVGFDSPAHLHSPTPIYTALPSILRECLATLKYMLIG
jgi:uncharacterized SAM-binding protein YcdF (DUF218 family)